MTQRARMLEKAREWQIGSYIRKYVAVEFQKLIRAEAAAQQPGYAPAMLDCIFSAKWRGVGECVCVTCGKVEPWSSGLKGMHTGHFLASRRHSILLEEANVAPQCSRCNRYEGGAPQLFRQWMQQVRPDEIERLEALKNQTRQFTREELVDLRIGYKQRLKAAMEKLC